MKACRSSIHAALPPETCRRPVVFKSCCLCSPVSQSPFFLLPQVLLLTLGEALDATPRRAPHPQAVLFPVLLGAPPPQVVLLASGDALDATRPFRLPLPRLCAVFDVSPAGPYEWSSARLKGLPAMQ